jgi:hypothetical protein
VFFDDETAIILHRWIVARETRNEKGIKALFINNEGGRLNRNGVYLAGFYVIMLRFNANHLKLTLE